MSLEKVTMSAKYILADESGYRFEIDVVTKPIYNGPDDSSRIGWIGRTHITQSIALLTPEAVLASLLLQAQHFVRMLEIELSNGK